MTLLTDAEKAADKFNSQDKNSQYTRNRELSKPPSGDIMLNGERLNFFPLRSGTRQGYLLSTLYSSSNHYTKARKRN